MKASLGCSLICTRGQTIETYKPLVFPSPRRDPPTPYHSSVTLLSVCLVCFLSLSHLFLLIALEIGQPIGSNFLTLFISHPSALQASLFSHIHISSRLSSFNAVFISFHLFSLDQYQSSCDRGSY